MCVIYLAFEHVPEYPLILLANRDEYYARTSMSAGYWEDYPEIYAGRDLVAGGTWLGVTKSGRFAAVTNYREPGALPGTQSRGNLVADFLKSESKGPEYLAKVQEKASKYSGFNLLVGQISHNREIYYYSNRQEGITNLKPGIYGLSNRFLDTPWPKVNKGKERLAELLNGREPSEDELFSLLSDETIAPDAELPSTGVPLEVERSLSAILIRMPGYGTRSSTILTFDQNSKWTFVEHTADLSDTI